MPSKNHLQRPGKTPTTLSEFVCHRIRRLRLEKGFPAGEVARRAGIANSSYSCLETGRYRMSLDNLFRILAVLGASIVEVWPASPDAAPLDRVTDEHLERTIREALGREGRRLSIEDILQAVTRAFDVQRRRLKSRSRQRELSDARVAAAMLARENKHLSLVALSRELNRHPSSLNHSLRRAEDWLPGAEGFRRRLGLARDLLEAHCNPASRSLETMDTQP